MNIVMVPSWFATKENHTLGSFFLNQAKALQNAGHKVYILYYDLFSVKTVMQYFSYYEDEVEDYDGVTVYRKKVFAPMKHGEIYGCKKAAAKAVCSLYDKYLKNKVCVDVIHAQSCIWAGYAAMKLSEKIKISYVVTEHSTMFQLRPHMIKPVKNEVVESFNKAASVIAVSKALENVLSPLTHVNRIVPNVIETERFVIKEDNKKNDVFTFLSVAYLHDIDKKGLPLLLRSFAEIVNEKNVSARLRIGGDGDRKHELEELCQELSIDDKVDFIGDLSRDQVVKEMQQCDAFVLPSNYETFGVVYFEAMAVGKPVIATATGGPDPYITPETGYLIPVKNQTALVHALQEIISKRNTFVSQDIRDHVVKHFSPNAIAEQIEAVYREVINE